nr:transposase zinc-binding domain-containing protein [Cohnella sp. YIM B05605]
MKEVAEFRDRGNPKNGFKPLVCEGGHDLRLVLYRCKGRFCTTCSCGEVRSRLLEEDVFQVNHRHVIMTIWRLGTYIFYRRLKSVLREELRNFLF